MDNKSKKVISANIEIYKQLEQLDHVNIIKILSCEEKAGFIQVVEEEFESRTMEDVLQKHDIKGDTFYDWILQICDALEYLYKANPPITGVGLKSESILIGEDNILKLIDFSNAVNTISKDIDQTNDIDTIISLMKSIDKKFMKKYRSLIEDWDSDKGITTIVEFRKKIIEAFTARFGIKRVVLVGVFGVFLLMLRLFRRLF